MERTPTQIDNLGIVALMAGAPLAANALLFANALEVEPPGDEAARRFEPSPQTAGAETEATRRGLLDRIDNWFWRLEQRALEARLAEATDIHDLELRIRELERGAPWWSH